MLAFALRIVVLWTVVLLSSTALAQDGRGSIVGRLTDPSGAVVVGAGVTATHLATRVAAVTQSNEAGNFAIPYLLPGIYTLQVEMAGFKKLSREGIQVRVSDVVQLNVELELGSTAESVEVRAETPLLATAEAGLGQVVDERRIVELPQFGGSPIAFVHLSPGVINGTNLRQSDRGSANVNSQFTTNGAGMYNNEFTIDGVSNSIADTSTNSSSGRVAFIPPQNAIGEFKVQTASFDAAIGHTSGSLINVSIKSGANDVHGAAHWFVRNRIFDAPDLFQNRAGQRVSVYQSNRYGLSAGGPVKAPRVYDGRNRTFWFYAWEEMRHGIPVTLITTVPTDAMRRGDLSGLLALGSNYQVYDPATTAAAAGGRFSRQPIPNNVIPASRLDPVSLKLLEFWPRSNQPGTPEGRNNFYWSEPTETRNWVHLGRLDHAFSQNHRAFLRLNGDLWRSEEGYYFGRDNKATGTIQSRKNRGLAVDDVYVISPSFLLNVRYGLTHQQFTERRRGFGTDLAALGFSPRLLALTEKNTWTLPRVTLSPFNEIGAWGNGDGVGAAQTHSLSGTVTRLTGSHNLRAGADIRVHRQNRNQNPLQVAPHFSFSAAYTRGPLDNSPAPAVGGEVAAFLLGIPGGSMERTASSAEQDRYLGLYVQDDFKLSRKLTVNLGLRYEFEAPVTERFDRSVAHFAFDQSSPIEAQARANYAAGRQVPELPLDSFRLRGGLTFVNAGGNPRAYWRPDKQNFMPRAGFAYQLFPKTVLRGGYGIFFDSVGVANSGSIQTGFSQSTPIQASLDSGLTFVATMADPFPNGLLQPLGAAGGLATNLGQAISFFPERRRNPYGQRWSFGFQQVLPVQIVAEASYVGNRATRLNINRDVNALPAQYLSRSPIRDTATINFLSEAFPNPLAGTNPIYGVNTSRSSILRPFPQFGSVTVAHPQGYSWYHSLQLRAEKRLSRGHTFHLSYTWSKTMEAIEYLNASAPAPYRSIANLDRTHRLVASAIVELPFGKGRRVGSNWARPLDFVAGGWQLNMVVQRQSGPPLGFGDVWTLFTGNPDNVVLPKSQRGVDRWFNIDAGFNRNAAQQLASNIRVSPLRFGGVRADGQARWDFSAIKNFRVAEKLMLQFRAEALNAWNHPNLFAPNTTPTSSAFGTITRQDVPRIWQLALKLTF